MEDKNLLKRQDMIESDQMTLEQLRVEDAEKHNAMKIELETDIQNCMQQLQDMQATYLLNKEKLEYNFNVLSERDAENQTTITQQKKKIARLQDMLNSKRAQYKRADDLYRHQNSKLTAEYRRATEQYKDLQAKFHHFEVSEYKQYLEVWQMNQTRVVDLARKVLQADQIIHEQQLGLKWVPPSSDLFTGANGDGSDGARGGDDRDDDGNGGDDITEPS